MNIEDLRTLCHSLKGTTEDVKWGNDLCFLIGEKMYCVTGLEGPFTASLKVRPQEFESLTERNWIIPAPYLARYHWVFAENGEALSPEEWQLYVKQSYNLVLKKLSKKAREEIANSK